MTIPPVKQGNLTFKSMPLPLRANSVNLRFGIQYQAFRYDLLLTNLSVLY